MLPEELPGDTPLTTTQLLAITGTLTAISLAANILSFFFPVIENHATLVNGFIVCALVTSTLIYIKPVTNTPDENVDGEYISNSDLQEYPTPPTFGDAVRGYVTTGNPTHYTKSTHDTPTNTTYSPLTLFKLATKQYETPDEEYVYTLKHGADSTTGGYIYLTNQQTKSIAEFLDGCTPGEHHTITSIGAVEHPINSDLTQNFPGPHHHNEPIDVALTITVEPGIQNKPTVHLSFTPDKHLPFDDHQSHAQTTTCLLSPKQVLDFQATLETASIAFYALNPDELAYHDHTMTPLTDSTGTTLIHWESIQDELTNTTPE